MATIEERLAALEQIHEKELRAALEQRVAEKFAVLGLSAAEVQELIAATVRGREDGQPISPADMQAIVDEITRKKKA